MWRTNLEYPQPWTISIESEGVGYRLKVRSFDGRTVAQSNFVSSDAAILNTRFRFIKALGSITPRVKMLPNSGCMALAGGEGILVCSELIADAQEAEKIAQALALALREY